jgi:hypothetical protein
VQRFEVPRLARENFPIAGGGLVMPPLPVKSLPLLQQCGNGVMR